VENVPVGRYTDGLLQRAAVQFGAGFREQVLAHVVSREANVRQVLAKVELGEADAAIVYRTDVRPGRPVRTLEVPTTLSEPTAYAVAAATHAPHPELARAFVDLLLSPAGQRALADAGFTPGAPR